MLASGPADLWQGADLARVTAGDGQSFRPALSGDGRVVAFQTMAGDIVAGLPADGFFDVVVADLTGAAPTFEVASQAMTPGTAGDMHSYVPFVSRDGRHVGFSSYAGNLVANDTNRAPEDPFTGSDVFLRDRSTTLLARVSVGQDGTQGDGNSAGFSTTPDGRLVVFDSFATNLVAGDTNDASDVFLVDRTVGTIERLSVSSAGVAGDGGSGEATVSEDGRFVAFSSVATNLVAGDTNGVSDVFIHDRFTHETERVATGATNVGLPRISADGRTVVFTGPGTGAAGGLIGVQEVFVLEVASGRVEQVHVRDDGAIADGLVLITYVGPTISADGRFVAFVSAATNLVAGDTNGVPDVFVVDRMTHHIELISESADGVLANGGSGDAWISDDGTAVAFASGATNLGPGGSNGTSDIFVRRR